MLPFAPGSRAVIRDEEWLIRRIDPSADGGWLLTCDGISDLVRGQSALFLTALEDTIPGGPREVQRTYTAPFVRASREDDCRVAWAFFAQN